MSQLLADYHYFTNVGCDSGNPEPCRSNTHEHKMVVAVTSNSPLGRGILGDERMDPFQFVKRDQNAQLQPKLLCERMLNR